MLHYHGLVCPRLPPRREYGREGDQEGAVYRFGCRRSSKMASAQWWRVALARCSLGYVISPKGCRFGICCRLSVYYVVALDSPLLGCSMPAAHAPGNAQATVGVWASVWLLVQGGQAEGAHARGGLTIAACTHRSQTDRGETAGLYKCFILYYYNYSSIL